ncbi:MAG TPA: hypothetical protein P5102_16920 [Candidatus Competibacteraceae bacterium]|nr:hypothetical protein [Candidatus Competibacteraceae bacterium]
MLALPSIVLRDHLVLCEADRLRVLNPTARCLWEIHRDTGDVGRAAAWLVETYGLSVEQAKQDIAALFRPDPQADPGAGELPTTPALRATPPCPRRGKNLAEPAMQRTSAIATRAYESHYRLYDRPFALRCTTAELARAIEPLFAHLRVEAVAGPWFEIAGHDDGFTGWRDQQGLFATASLDGAVIGLFSAILQYACAERDSIAILHAGAVSNSHTALVLAEAGGRGKSTLTAALLARGYRYLSDDVVPLERGSGYAIPVPICLNLKPGSVPVLADLYPELPHLPAWRSGNRSLRFLSPPEFARRRPDRPYPVAALVFPRYQPNAEPTLQPLDPVAVLTRLMETDTLFDRPLNPAKIGELCAWIEATPAYTLAYGDLAAALETLATLWP